MVEEKVRWGCQREIHMKSTRQLTKEIRKAGIRSLKRSTDKDNDSMSQIHIPRIPADRISLEWMGS